MRYVGIDVAAETHVVAAVDEQRMVVLKPTKFTEDVVGYEKLRKLLGSPEATLVAMEATGHYWRNLFVELTAQGFAVALLNPLRTRRFADEDLERTKTDAIDALSIARFAAEKRPGPTRLPNAAEDELRELVRLRDRLVQDFGDRTRQLHRLVDLGFPELSRYVRNLDSELATAILHKFPTAQAFLVASGSRLSRLCYDGRHKVGLELAQKIRDAAKVSVGRHHGQVYHVHVRYICEDLDLLRRHIREVENAIERKLGEHQVGSLLTSFEGIGIQTAARIIAACGDPARFRSAAALAAYVGVIPGLKHSGKRRPTRAGLASHGNGRLRSALWMPTLVAVQKNPWLRAYYQRLRARGKLPKVALVAAMRKLLHAVYWIATHQRPFVTDAPRTQIHSALGA